MKKTITVYPNLHAMIGLPQLRPISDIPNQVGFKLTLVKCGATGGESHTTATVQKDANGLHLCVDLKGNYRLCTAFDGWRPA